MARLEKKTLLSAIVILIWVVVSYYVNMHYYELTNHKLFVILLFIVPLLVPPKRDFLLFILWLPNFFIIESPQFYSIAIYIILVALIRFVSIRYDKKDIMLIISNHFISNFALDKLRFGVFDIAATVVLFACLMFYLSY